MIMHMFDNSNVPHLAEDGATAMQRLEEHGYVALEEKLLADVLKRLGPVGPTEVLRARPSSDSNPWSLSGKYGLGAFPWHTDGAISARPPRWIALKPLHISKKTYTELLQPSVSLLKKLKRTVLRARDKNDTLRYLPAAIVEYDGVVRLRWDPRTCKPRNEAIIHAVDTQQPTARHYWHYGLPLIFDNWKLLHRRPAVGCEETRVLERTYIWG